VNATIYQEQAARTLLDAPGFDIPDQQIMLLWNAIGLAGEAGEVAEHIKKGVLHQHGIDPAKLGKELGDVLWYVAGLCTKAGLDLSVVMADNIEKLQVRYPNGFTSGDSVRRVDLEQQPAPAATWPDPERSLRTRLDNATALNRKLQADLDTMTNRAEAAEATLAAIPWDSIGYLVWVDNGDDDEQWDAAEKAVGKWFANYHPERVAEKSQAVQP
jgi:NTP pyrophosphatase (non-canonical NTP hydrolase)